MKFWNWLTTDVRNVWHANIDMSVAVGMWAAGYADHEISDCIAAMREKRDPW